MTYIYYAISIVTGILVCVPLVIELVSWVKAAVKERNWAALLRIVMNLMAEAEEKFTIGADKKVFVMSQIAAAAASVGYNYDADAEQKVSDMIDAMCAMSHIVNGDKYTVSTEV